MLKKIRLSNLYQSELISGILLMISFIAAVLISNIAPLQGVYKNFVFYPITLGFQNVIHQIPLIKIVNDGLMTFFFLLIGLELKFHLVRGEFKEKQTLFLPGFAAVGGIVVPALIYLWMNRNSPHTLGGWAIPIATDTAFMLGILAFFGNLVSARLRAFIIGFSLIDDAIALVILAIFYSTTPNILAITLLIALVGALWTLNRLKVTRSFYYLFLGIFLWIAMVESGIHGTLCGIILALAIPVEKSGQINPSFHGLENVLRPVVYFLILPLFAFINSGVSLSSISLDVLSTPISLGIIFGLFLGKQIGVFLFSYAAVKLNCCTLPETICWPKLYAIGVLGGIGFTLSLFIGDITFEHSEPNYIMRVSVIIGSLLSALLGSGILYFLKKTDRISHRH